VTRATDLPSRAARRSRAAFTVGAGIFFSRVSGFIRSVLLASFFGASGLMDVWVAATKIPNVIQNLLGEGTLSASVIPVYAEFLEEGREEEAGRFAGAVLGILMTVAGGAALLGMFLAPVFVPLAFFRWDPDKLALTTIVVQILFPMTAVLVVSAWALAILNSHRRFLVSYMAPVAWNGAIVATVVAMGFGFGWSGRQLLLAAAWGALGGGILQFVVQLPYVVPLLEHFRLSLDRTVSGVGEAVRNFVPVVTARGVVNIGSLLDVFVAGLLAEGALAALGYAQMLYVLPISLFGMAIAASELPELSRQRKAPASEVAPQVSAALGRIHFLLVPSMAAFLLLGDVFIGGLYQRGEFRSTDTPVVYAVLAAYALGLLASSGSRVHPHAGSDGLSPRVGVPGRRNIPDVSARPVRLRPTPLRGDGSRTGRVGGRVAGVRPAPEASGEGPGAAWSRPHRARSHPGSDGPRRPRRGRLQVDPRIDRTPSRRHDCGTSR